MPFVTGLFLIDAPASALNNMGQIPGRTDNAVGVKFIKARDGAYPYVSAQAFRYWLRTTLETSGLGWRAAPVFREERVAYADANPIKYWDDDLFGYMRAPSKKTSAQKQREQDESRIVETPTRDTVTRVSPFRVSTLVSISPVTITEDFGVMARQEGDPVPYTHQFYRATLKGLFSLDLRSAGTFWYRNKTGFRNLDEERVRIAREAGLEHLQEDRAYRLPLDERVQRVATLFEGLARLEGGAKQALHYTDVSPVVAIMAVTKGGNHIFGHVIGATARGLPEIHVEALKQVLNVFADDILSPVYVGWVRGYMDEERSKLEAFVDSWDGVAIRIMHPREAFAALANDLRRPENREWIE